MLKEYLSTIANAIRSKLGSTAKINAQNFADKIGEVYDAGQLKTLQDSEYMNAKVSGTAIAVNDVSPIEHSVGCKVESKNLLPPKFNTVNDENWGQKVNNERRFYFENLKVGQTYTFSLKKIKAIANYGFFFISKEKDGVTTNVIKLSQGGSSIKTNASFTVEEGYTYYAYVLFSAAPEVIDADDNFVALGNFQLELGTTATDYTPYLTDLSDVEVKRYEGNLIDDTLKKMAGTNIYFGTKDFSKNFTTLFPGTYTLSAKVKDNSKFTLYVTDFENGNQNISGWSVAGTTECSLTINVSKTTKVNFKVYHSTFTDASFLEWAKLEVGSTATPYEPYIAPTSFQANLDGTVEGITSVSPNMTLIPSNDGVVINANYLRDIDTYIDNLITDVALTGGE